MLLYRCLTMAQYNELLINMPLTAKKQDANIHPEMHILNGTIPSQWISTSKEFFELFSGYKDNTWNDAIVKIDTSKCGNVEIIDCSNDLCLDNAGVFKKRARNFAKGAREVLISGQVPRGACTLLMTPISRTEVKVDNELVDFFLKKLPLWFFF